MVGCHHRLNGHEFEQLWEMVKVREAWVLQSMGSQRVGHDLATEQQHTFEYVTSKAKNNAKGGFPGGPMVQNLPSNAGDMDLIPGGGTKIPQAMGQLCP